MYLTYSRKIKKEIEDSDLLACFDKRLETPYIIAHLSATIYRVGTLPSGVHVAMRKAMPISDSVEVNRFSARRNLEAYARNAEWLSEDGKDVVSFCIGIEFGLDVALLFEDVSEGGSATVLSFPPPHHIVHYVTSPKGKRAVWLDIDHKYKEFDPDIPFKFFAKENIIIC